MLVLGRSVGETIIIHDNKGLKVKVKLIENRQGLVLLGFDAPMEIAVDREEIYNRKQQQKANA